MKQENRNLVTAIVLFFGLSLVVGCLSGGGSGSGDTKQVSSGSNRQCVCHIPPSCPFDVCSAGFDNGHLNHDDPRGRCNSCGNAIKECCLTTGPTDSCGTEIATECCIVDCQGEKICAGTHTVCNTDADCGGDPGSCTTCVADPNCGTNGDGSSLPECNQEECDDGDNDCNTNNCTADCKAQPNCDDGNPCTDDSCNNGDPNQGGGLCINTPNDDPCDDDDDCSLGDQCIGGVCTPGAPKDCSDGISCTIDSCEPDGGACSSDDSQCECFVDADCDDHNSCTDEVCVDNVCQRSNNTAPCNDNIFCNGSDTCGGGACSQHEGNPCTQGGECADDCNEDADNCNDTQGVPCTDDQNVCTDDFCDGLGVCVHIPIDGSAPITCGVGICLRAVDSCEGGQPQDCIPGAPNPTGEICDNGLDDDCNGLVDDDCGELAGCIAVPGNTPPDLTFSTPEESGDGTIEIGVNILDDDQSKLVVSASADEGTAVVSNDGKTVTYTPPSPLPLDFDGEALVTVLVKDAATCGEEAFTTTVALTAAGDTAFGGCSLLLSD